MEKTSPSPLTPKEKTVLEYIEQYFVKNGYSPTFTEIKDFFGFASYNSVQRYLKQLQKKNYLQLPGGNQKRALTLLNSSRCLQNDLNSLNSPSHTLRAQSGFSQTEPPLIPLLGKVAAGLPLEAIEYDEFVPAPIGMIKDHSKTFALKVVGESMIEDGILDGDVLFIHEQKTALNGQIAVAVIENEATVKRIYFSSHQKNQVELRPSNSQMPTMYYPASRVDIKGVVIGLLRQY